MKNSSMAYLFTAATLVFQGCQIQPPEPNFTISATTIKAHDSITFTDASSNEPTKWIWRFTGGSITESDEPSVTVRFDIPGNYTATLYVENETGHNTISKFFTVLPADTKVAYGGLITGGVEGRFAGDPNHVLFARYAVKDGGDVHVVNREGGIWQAYAYGPMVTALNQFGGQMNTATWIGGNNDWIVAYGTDQYVSAGIPGYVLDELVKFTNKGDRFRRIDMDSEGHFAILSNQKWLSWSNSGINNVLGNGIVSFAFGINNNWVAVSPHDYWTSSQIINNDLMAKLAELKQGNYEFVDIEIGNTGWIIVYR